MDFKQTIVYMQTKNKTAFMQEMSSRAKNMVHHGNSPGTSCLMWKWKYVFDILAKEMSVSEKEQKWWKSIKVEEG